MEFFKQTQYENYEVSNYGTVRNTKTGKVLKGGESKSSGYRKVSLSVKGSKKTVTREVHRLVAETFLGLHKGLVVDHIDDNPLNNHIDNLQWITQSQNILKAKRKKKKNQKLTEAQKQEIRDSNLVGEDLRQYFNVKFNLSMSRSGYRRIISK
jgi:hypothetical protein